MRVHRFVSNDFTVRVAAVDATEVVAEMQILQNSYPLATVAVGRAMIGSILMASNLKDGQEIGVLFKGNGPLKSVYAEASFDGKVRGYCPYSHYQAPQKEDQLNVKKALGNGHLTVTRNQPFQKQPHSGTVEIVDGEISPDIAYYLHQSQQIRSIVSLGVYLDEYGRVKSAGGVLIEVMPGVEDEVVTKLETNAHTIREHLSVALLNGMKVTDFVKPYMAGIPYTEIPHDYEVKYSCPCTVDRVMRALGTLGPEGLQEMIDDKESADITCQMCGRQYKVSVQELESLKVELRKSSMH